jgi:isoleucyl-tRNA synthetase
MTDPGFFRNVPGNPDLVASEAAILEFWKDKDIFHESMRRREGAPEWVFYEGPPTANGRPGIHHVWARIFKDIYPRFQTMRGRYVPRKAGRDCHGLPVELEVEKALGFTQKADIEDYGVEAFNAKCRESVQEYVSVWNDMTERIGFWVDLDDAYWTMDADYVESVWHNLASMYDKGLLYESYRVVPYCPRCETALSDHEVAQGYEETTDPSVFVRFPLVDGEEDLAIWTTTPWTLISNSGVVVHPEVTYVTAEVPGARPVIIAADAVTNVLGEGVATRYPRPGSALVGLRYERPYPQVDIGAEPRVVADEFVTTTEGTGLVHMAPAFGEIDMEIGKREDLGFANPVGADGAFTDGPWGGVFVKEADPQIIADLDERGILLRSDEYLHTYPFCWRCGTPLLYRAKESWFVRTGDHKADLLAVNDSINWHPAHIRTGRMGHWLENNVDWALSRDRYWGTPLPIWRCAQRHDTAIGSFARLAELSGEDLTGFDPHRPFVDDIAISCPDCSEPARRVPPVIDTWYDSGSMPNGQWHWPFENDELYRRRYPADFIAEAIDQTRGWFYSLLAIATLLTDQTSYRNVLSLGHIVDRDGAKMSKSVGNVLDPFEVLDAQGADALRWYFFAAGTPWTNSRVFPEAIDEFARRTLFTLWHTYAFLTTYADLDGWAPEDGGPPVAERPVMDRWILSRLDALIADVTADLEDFDAYRGSQRIADFVDDLSNWYVRRSRPRFWRGVREAGGIADADKSAAHATLHTCVLAVTTMLAPYIPFLTEELYQNLTGHHFGDVASVHFEDWPEPMGNQDEQLEADVTLARKVVSLGRTARTDAKVRTRQPLPRLLVSADGDLSEELLAEVLDELNVKALERGDIGAARSATIKPDFARLGPKLGSRVQQVRAALASMDGTAAAAVLERDGHLTVEVGGEPVALTAEDVSITIESAEGWSVAEDGGVAVALDLTVTPELGDEGWIRELTHALQNARKDAGLAVEDRIRLHLEVPAERARLVETYGRQLQRDLLALDLALRTDLDGVTLQVDDDEVTASIARL